MLKKICCAVIIASLVICPFIMTSCSSQTEVEVDQSITPHDVALKAISELGYTETDLAKLSNTESESEAGGQKKITEYYSEGSEDYMLDDNFFDILFGSNADGLTLSMIEQYSIMMFDKDLSVPFELMIFKLPKTDDKNDSELINKVKKLFANNLDQYKRTMQDYLSEFIPYAEQAKVKVTDNFVYYCMAEDSSKITTAIYNYLSGK